MLLVTDEGNFGGASARAPKSETDVQLGIGGRAQETAHHAGSTQHDRPLGYIVEHHVAHDIVQRRSRVALGILERRSNPHPVQVDDRLLGGARGARKAQAESMPTASQRAGASRKRQRARLTERQFL